MIKTFESFEDFTDLEELLNNLRIICNYSYPPILLHANSFSSSLYDKVMYDYGLFKDIKDINLNTLTTDDISTLTKLYTDFSDKYDLSQMVDYVDVGDVLVPFFDKSIELNIEFDELVEVVYNFDNMICSIHIDTTPGSKSNTRVNSDKHYFELSSYEEIINDIITCSERFTQLGYVVKSYMDNKRYIVLEIKK